MGGMFTYIIGALAVALVAGYSGAIPRPAPRRPVPSDGADKLRDTLGEDEFADPHGNNYTARHALRSPRQGPAVGRGAHQPSL